ncbi:MAG: hypothetical protein KBT77_10605 [Thalassolituus oleivorans]|uniref:contractile injection system tape measure protein n=1 Tax=Thalassolituus oleivorans TaxID=187493 RepID=UPI001B49B906|nr:contractile injection system tape measure protein [Thalassolituus oleivorans]MBQ0727784.1 hypothetical protein [Thalassolituus oleivorans]
MTHQVRTANFRLKGRNQPLSSDDRQRWQDWFEQTFADVLDALLDEWIEARGFLADNTIVELDKLTLDLGFVRMDDPVDQLVHNLRRQLQEQLVAHPPRVIAPAVSRLQNYLFFLKNGFWQLSESDSMLEDFERWVFEHPEQLDDIRNMLLDSKHNKALWIRFFLQHSSVFLDRFIGDTVPIEILNAFAVHDFWVGFGEREKAFLLSYAALVFDHRDKSLAEFISYFAASTRDLRLTISDSRSAVKLYAHLHKAETSFESFGAANGQIDTALLDVVTDDDVAADDIMLNDRVIPDSVLVSHAGIVLLQPFLERLFKNFNWLDAERKIRVESRSLAVYALHFAATGKECAPEPELLFYKAILGMPLALPMPSSMALDNTLKQEIEVLLQALINHWGALKNTSINGLRETFLQRRGSLREEADGFTLHVDHKTLDILLQSLPWSINVIAFAWLNKPIFVDWKAS